MKVVFIVIGFIFIIFFMLNRCSHQELPANTQDANNPIAQRQDILDQIVLLQPLKQYASKDYESIQQTANGVVNVNEIEASVSSTLWWKLREIIEKKADDEGQRLWANAYLQQLYDAKRKGDCFPISFPLYSKTSPQQRRALLSQNTQQRSSEALTYILTHNGKRSVVDRMQAPEAWSQVADKLRQDYGAEADLINSGETAEDKNKQCEVVVRTFEYILSLPQEQQGPVIRWFLDKHISVGIF
ncbi:hypothetical protein [Acinetobacter junii]|uniref:hypothetical protein n=1 Tax=Acinetobacter junii TaxID=40215 RepID=UPI00301A6CC4